MKVIVIGGTGTLGKAIVNELQKRHEVMVVGHSQGDIQVDITNSDSIEKMYQQAGSFHAVVSATGKAHFANLADMTLDNYYFGLNSKLMGQVNLVLIGSRYIQDGGSFTLISGILATEPLRTASSAAMVNGAINSFVQAAAIEMPRGIRINAVSPTIVEESMAAYGDIFTGYEPVPSARVGLAYSKSVNGLQTGKIYTVA